MAPDLSFPDDFQLVLPRHTPEDDIKRSGSTYSCGGCKGVFTGLATAHCPTCHETFSTVSTFDVHRATVHTPKGRANTVRCLTVEEMTAQLDTAGNPVASARVLVFDLDRGVWHGPPRPDGWGREQ